MAEKMEQNCGAASGADSGDMAQEVMSRFNAAHEKVVSVLEDYVTGGYVQTLARVLVYMGKERSPSVLERLPEGVREEVQKAYAALSDKKADDAEIIAAAGFILNESGFFGKEMSQPVLEGLPSAGLKELSLRLDSLFTVDPLLSMNIDMDVFPFEDIIKLDDRSIQKVLRDTDQQVLAKALKELDEAICNKIFRNMSRRAAAMLKEDMEFIGPVKPADVEEARNEIISIIRNLIDTGEISGEDY